jgi:dCTP deaminase
VILSSEEIARRLEEVGEGVDRLQIAPTPELSSLRGRASASIDLRLGTWFVTTKLSQHSQFDVYQEEASQPTAHALTSRHYVPFGKKFVLHPRSFVLAATLEWLKLPRNLCGYVTGKSSWGRRGLVIETAPGVHPSFTGCLTLELANVGEIPIVLIPGIQICQLFLHRVDGQVSEGVDGTFWGKRQPELGSVKVDLFARNLALDEGRNKSNTREGAPSG